MLTATGTGDPAYLAGWKRALEIASSRLITACRSSFVGPFPPPPGWMTSSRAIRPSLVTTASSASARSSSDTSAAAGNASFEDALGRFIPALATTGFRLEPAGDAIA